MEKEKGEILVFLLGNKEYGLPVEKIRKILAAPLITSIPLMPPRMLGIMNYRNSIVPLLELKEILREDIEAPVILTEEEENAGAERQGMEKFILDEPEENEDQEENISLKNENKGPGEALFLIARGAGGLTGLSVDAFFGVKKTEGAKVLSRENKEYDFGIKVKEVILRDPAKPRITILEV